MRTIVGLCATAAIGAAACCEFLWHFRGKVPAVAAAFVATAADLPAASTAAAAAATPPATAPSAAPAPPAATAFAPVPAIAPAPSAALLSSGPAILQITLAPTWGARRPLAVDYVLNVQVRSAPDDASAAAEWRACVRAYRAQGTKVGMYISGDLSDPVQDVYYPPATLIPDPAWRWGQVRAARGRDGLPVVAKYGDSALRWTMDRSHAQTRAALANRAIALIEQRAAAAGLSPDFVYLDNAAHVSSGGTDSVEHWCEYAERIATALGTPAWINVTGTPAAWSQAEWQAVEFTQAVLEERGLWLGFSFEMAHRGVQLSPDSTASATESDAYERLVAVGVRVAWFSVYGTDRAASQRRLVVLAREQFRDGIGPYVSANWFQALPDWAGPVDRWISVSP
ncbi:MAG: hypothetical protein IPM64_17210 [Phycisphaerales bacterium]|nr:hypothetical protein [Phycisphaerales bacterium]